MTQPRNLHMTLAFIGNIDEARIPDLAQVAQDVRFAPCMLALDRCNWWKHNRIVWAGGEAPSALSAAAQELRKGLAAAGIRFDAKAFVPHVTLLRDARTGEGLPQVAELAWPVRDFVLVSSDRDAAGPLYRIVAGPFPEQ